MELDLDLQFGEEVTPRQKKDTPEKQLLEKWSLAALSAANLNGCMQMTIRVVGEEEITSLNETYRDKGGATNVLSFSFDAPDGVDLPLLGDIVICAPVVEKQAVEQKKSLRQHWAQMVVHGTLHLIGYDHISEQEAEVMEAMEINILASFGFPNPYIEINVL